MLLLHLPGDHSCGHRARCVGSLKEMLPFQCTAGCLAECLLTLRQNKLHDEP